MGIKQRATQSDHIIFINVETDCVLQCHYIIFVIQKLATTNVCRAAQARPPPGLPLALYSSHNDNSKKCSSPILFVESLYLANQSGVAHLRLTVDNGSG